MGLKINKEEIFNSNPTKILINEFENLKKDYSKMNAIRYKSYYENQPLSFILDNSRYIFTESYKGYDFYKNIIENHVLPLDRYDSEYTKLYEFVNSSYKRMPDSQYNMYKELLETVENKLDTYRNSINLYTSIMENIESIYPYYDALYEYKNTNDINSLNKVLSLYTESNTINLIDAINLGITLPEASSYLCEYVNNAYVESPNNAIHFKLNSFTTNVLSRVLKDRYFSEKVSLHPNTTLRVLIEGIGHGDESDIISLIKEDHNPDKSVDYYSPEEAVNRIYEDTLSDFLYEEENNTERELRLLYERAIIETNLSFALIDEMFSDDNDKADRNSIVEKFAIDSGNYYNIPNTISEHICIFENRLNEIDEELHSINERYFSKTLEPSQPIAKSMGPAGSDNYKYGSNKYDDEELSKSHYKHEYEPVNDTDDDDDEDDNTDYVKRQLAKSRQTAKYADMDLNSDEFKGILERKDSEDDIKKPKDPSLARKIQNKATENNFKFKRKLAEGKKSFREVKNAGKAVAKIPNDISTQIKKQLEEWDEADDNKRKEYMLKPGVRKKYYRLLKLAIIHGAAFAINPLLVIITGIGQYVSDSKDVRIRNELIRELKAEIKVCEEKIEDARANGDNKQKYKLVRLKEKLEGEYNRVTINSKSI